MEVNVQPQRVLAHVCRRGEVHSGAIGAIAIRPTVTTFGVAAGAAAEFARRAQRRDRREPHLFIERDDFDVRAARGPRGARAGARARMQR